MRELAVTFDRLSPDIFCAHGIGAGDAYALATRFDRRWAYRGSHAIFWTERFEVDVARDRRRSLFARRPFVRVEGTFDRRPLVAIATDLARGRSRVRELRELRTELRRLTSASVLFVAHMTGSERIGLSDLEYRVAFEGADRAIFVRDPR